MLPSRPATQSKLEEAALFLTLDHVRGNRNSPAEMLGISLRTLQNPDRRTARRGEDDSSRLRKGGPRVRIVENCYSELKSQMPARRDCRHKFFPSASFNSSWRPARELFPRELPYNGFMCGIVVMWGTARRCRSFLEGLKRLEYRGYDSAGRPVYGEDHKPGLRRAKGKLRNTWKIPSG